MSIGLVSLVGMLLALVLSYFVLHKGGDAGTRSSLEADPAPAAASAAEDGAGLRKLQKQVSDLGAQVRQIREVAPVVAEAKAPAVDNRAQQLEAQLAESRRVVADLQRKLALQSEADQPAPSRPVSRPLVVDDRPVSRPLVVDGAKRAGDAANIEVRPASPVPAPHPEQRFEAESKTAASPAEQPLPAAGKELAGVATHEVQKGETLSQLSRTLCFRQDEFRALNPRITDLNNVKPGMKINYRPDPSLCRTAG